MKKSYLSAILLITGALSFGQITFINENFENNPSSFMYNGWPNSGPISFGSPSCSQASQGMASDFVSTYADLSGNISRFAGNNPDAPYCGGYNTAIIRSAEMDLSSATDYATLAFDYYAGGGLNWGGSQPVITVQIHNPTGSFTLISYPPSTGSILSWQTEYITISNIYLTESSYITFELGGGEAAAVDNIELIGYEKITGLLGQTENTIESFPNPATEFIQINNDLDISSVKILDLNGRTHFTIATPDNAIDISSLQKGSYILLLEGSDGEILRSTFIKD